MAKPFHRALHRELDFHWHSPWNILCTVVMPVFLLVAIALLFNGGTIRQVPLIVVDRDHSNLSRMLEQRLGAAPGIAVVGNRLNLDEAMSDIRARRAFAVAYVPSNLERDVQARRQATVIFYLSEPFLAAASTLEREAADVTASVGATAMMDEVARGDIRRVKAPPVSVQVTNLFNPGLSYELMLVSLIHPAILIVCLTMAVMWAAVRAFDPHEFGGWIRTPREIIPAIFGKVTPYVLLYFLYGVVAIVWLAWHGYPVRGSFLAVIAGYGIMLITYALFAVFVASCTRDAPMAFGFCAVYALSALAFSGAIFPVRSGLLFARTWSDIQPYSWDAELLIQQWQMGISVTDSVRSLAILLVMAPISCGAAWLGLRLVLHDTEASRP